MSDPKQLAKAAREHLAQALSALQSAADIPEDLEDTADLIAEAMSTFHKIERSAALDGRSDAYRKVRRALDRFLDWPLPHPVMPILVESAAFALAKAYALAKWSGEQQVRADLTPPPPLAIAPVVIAPAPVVPVAPVVIAPAPVVPVAPAPIVPAPVVPVAPAPIVPVAPAPVVIAIAPAPAVIAPKPAPSPAPVPVPAPLPVVPAPIPAPKPLLAPVIELPPAPEPKKPAPAPEPKKPAPAPESKKPEPEPKKPAPAPEKRESLKAPPPGTPSLDVELSINSASNFYRGLLGNDVVESGGIFVSTYKIPKIGTTFALRIQMPGGFSFEAHAVVQWTRAMGNSFDSAEPGFGARITQITQEGRHLIERYTRNREPIFYDDL